MGYTSRSFIWQIRHQEVHAECFDWSEGVGFRDFTPNTYCTTVMSRASAGDDKTKGSVQQQKLGDKAAHSTLSSLPRCRDPSIDVVVVAGSKRLSLSALFKASKWNQKPYLRKCSHDLSHLMLAKRVDWQPTTHNVSRKGCWNRKTKYFAVSGNRYVWWFAPLINSFFCPFASLFVHYSIPTKAKKRLRCQVLWGVVKPTCDAVLARPFGHVTTLPTDICATYQWPTTACYTETNEEEEFVTISLNRGTRHCFTIKAGPPFVLSLHQSSKGLGIVETAVLLSWDQPSWWNPWSIMILSTRFLCCSLSRWRCLRACCIATGISQTSLFCNAKIPTNRSQGKAYIAQALVVCLLNLYAASNNLAM